MPWAAKRYTAREEYRAYSLMGLFGVNMPPLYEEGPRAFHRLQLEILREIDDESIFAWSDDQDLSGGFLALPVSSFLGSGGIVQVRHPLVPSERPNLQSYYRPPYNMTDRGLHFPARPLMRPENTETEGSCFENLTGALIPLHCVDAHNTNKRLICILLQRVTVGSSQWVRVNSEELRPLFEDEHRWLTEGKLQKWEGFYIRQLGRYKSPFQGSYSIRLEIDQLHPNGYGYEGYALKDKQLMQGQYNVENGVRRVKLFI